MDTQAENKTMRYGSVCSGKALGNSMAVPVMRWIGRRIELIETLP